MGNVSATAARSPFRRRGASVVLLLASFVAACTSEDATRSDPPSTATPPPGTAADVREGFEASIAALEKGEGIDAQDEELLEETDPSVSCPGSAPRAEVPPGHVELEIASVEDDCLVFEYEAVPVDELEDRMLQLREAPEVVAVSPIVIEATTDQTGEVRSWAHDHLAVPDTDDWTWPTGRGVTVAVIDSGIDQEHPDMEGQVSGRMTFPGDPGGDHGDNSHGTHVAGIVGAIGGNGTGIVGIAPGVEILDVPAVGNPHDGAPTIADGIRWAVDNGADVINMSLRMEPLPRPDPWSRLVDAGEAGSATEGLEAALVYADEAGVLMIASGGNCGNEEALARNCRGEVNSTAMPAASPEVWSVAATTSTDERALFSTEREYIDLAAPGEEILSLSAGGATRTLNGTSQAAPHVTGAVALLLAADGPLGELAERRRARAAIRLVTNNLVDLGDPGRDDSFGWGRLDIGAALEAAGWTIVNPFEGEWYAHSAGLRVRDDRTAVYAYRMYARAGIQFAEIRLRFTHVRSRSAVAVVTATTPQRHFETGDVVSLVLRPATGTVELRNPATEYSHMLCGPRAEPGFCGA